VTQLLHTMDNQQQDEMKDLNRDRLIHFAKDIAPPWYTGSLKVMFFSIVVLFLLATITLFSGIFISANEHNSILVRNTGLAMAQIGGWLYSFCAATCVYGSIFSPHTVIFLLLFGASRTFSYLDNPRIYGKECDMTRCDILGYSLLSLAILYMIGSSVYLNRRYNHRENQNNDFVELKEES